MKLPNHPQQEMLCPHCQAGLLWSEDRGAHCDGCEEFDPAADLPNDQTLTDGGAAPIEIGSVAM